MPSLIYCPLYTFTIVDIYCIWIGGPGNHFKAFPLSTSYWTARSRTAFLFSSSVITAKQTFLSTANSSCREMSHTHLPRTHTCPAHTPVQQQNEHSYEDFLVTHFGSPVFFSLWKETEPQEKSYKFANVWKIHTRVNEMCENTRKHGPSAVGFWQFFLLISPYDVKDCRYF